MARTVKLTVRLSGDEQTQIQRAAKERGYLSPTAFMRAAIRNELKGREGEFTEAEQRIASALERESRDIFRVYRGQQALFAVIDTLVKTFLTCVPEPPRDSMTQSVARARDRYSRFVKAAGEGMVGDSHAAMQDLVNRGD
jgi:Arc/MetJ-type ribon-helix-helix transcriptional regulator